MTRDEITRMAREAGFVSAEYWPDDFTGLFGCVERFAALVAAAEREACAMTAKESLQRLGVDWAITEAVMRDIRARRTSTISPATLIDPRGSLGEPIL